MRRDIFETMLTKLRPEVKFEVVSYEILPKSRLDESGEWLPDTSAVFVELRFDNSNPLNLNLTDYFTNLTGFEFSISRV